MSANMSRWTSLGFILVLMALQSRLFARGSGLQSNQTANAHGHCEGELFPCKGNSTQCIRRSSFCDDKEDCDNGSDEWIKAEHGEDAECSNINMDSLLDLLLGEKSEEGDDDDDNDDDDDTSIPCSQNTYPSVCNCTTVCSTNTSACNGSDTGSFLYCKDRDLTKFPENIPKNSFNLDISDNMIKALRRHHFVNLTQLRELDVTRNELHFIDDDVFTSLSQLEKLEMEACGLGNPASGIFKDLPNLNYLDISHNRITTLEDDDLHGLKSLKYLDLRDNRIRELRDEHFADLRMLIELYLSRNTLYVLESGTFSALENLKILRMVACELREIPTGLFANLQKLERLDLAHNTLTAIGRTHLLGLTSLKYLNLRDNMISHIRPQTFEEAPKVAILKMDFNRLTNLTQTMFEPLRMVTLTLRENRIRTIEDEVLANQGLLIELDLSVNLLNALRVGMFTNLTNLIRLNLKNNSISKLELGSLDTMIKLQHLDLRENPFVTFSPNLFSSLAINGILEWLYFDDFYMCGYAPHVRHCIPRTDGISSIENLLANALLRSAVWIVAILAFVGNFCVLLARCFLREDNRIHSFFITNLAVADLLMGLYLIIIGAHDMLFRGEYIQHDIMWRSSAMCKICGFLSFLSSEMSVMTLGVITLDRFICIVHPFKFKNRFLGQAAILMVCLWVFWIVLGALPVVHTSYFGSFYYGANGVCLPLQINDPYGQGWEFSLIIFVIFNLIAFVLIVYAYLKMFLTIRWSSLAMRSTKKNQEWPLVKRFGLIVLTDFLCWMPIIIVKFVAFGGISVSNRSYAWFAIFVLPVNSALNPILYTMTTKLFKQKILMPLGILPPKRQKPYDAASSVDDSVVSKTSGTRLSVISSKSRAGSVHASKTCPQIKANVLMSPCSVSVADRDESSQLPGGIQNSAPETMLVMAIE